MRGGRDQCVTKTVSDGKRRLKSEYGGIYHPAKMAKPRILLVDDDALLLRSLSRLLGARFEVTTAQTGAAAIRALQEHEHDLLLCDLDLGAETSHGVLATAKQLRPELPRVLLSSAPPDELEKLVDDGLAQIALAKTLPSVQLLAKLSALVS
jgi:CheY-like chemotaxis protein